MYGSFYKIAFQITMLFEVPCVGMQWNTVQTSVGATRWANWGCDFLCNIFQWIQMCRTILNFKWAFLLIDFPLENSSGLLGFFLRLWFQVGLSVTVSRWTWRFNTVTYFAVSSPFGAPNGLCHAAGSAAAAGCHGQECCDQVVESVSLVPWSPLVLSPLHLFCSSWGLLVQQGLRPAFTDGGRRGTELPAYQLHQ